MTSGLSEGFCFAIPTALLPPPLRLILSLYRPYARCIEWMLVERFPLPQTESSASTNHAYHSRHAAQTAWGTML